MSNKKSPLKEPPLHHPGQSLDEEIDKVMNEDGISYFVMIVFCLYLAVNEWYRWFHPYLPRPWVVTSVAVIAIGYSVIKLKRIMARVKSLRLGRDGEKIVGQYLEELREKGYRVLHDIVGKGFNVDHVVISPHGIFAIETKTLSKPVGRSSNVVFDGNTLLVDGHERNQYLIQVKSEASWLRTLLKESTGKSFPVRPVIVFPGWFVKGVGPEARRDIWVMHPEVLLSFITNEKDKLPQEDVQLATYHLSQYIKTLKS